MLIRRAADEAIRTGLVERDSAVYCREQRVVKEVKDQAGAITTALPPEPAGSGDRATMAGPADDDQTEPAGYTR